jgi:hypothetical protein
VRVTSLASVRWLSWMMMMIDGIGNIEAALFEDLCGTLTFGS